MLSFFVDRHLKVSPAFWLRLVLDLQVDTEREIAVQAELQLQGIIRLEGAIPTY